GGVIRRAADGAHRHVRREHAPSGHGVIYIGLHDPAPERTDAKLHGCSVRVLVLLETVGGEDLRRGERAGREVGTGAGKANATQARVMAEVVVLGHRARLPAVSLAMDQKDPTPPPQTLSTESALQTRQ